MSTPIEDGVNLGKRSGQLLRTVGIETLEQLRDIGSVPAWYLVKSAFPEHVTVIWAYAFEGAIRGVSLTLLSAAEKAALRRAVAPEPPPARIGRRRNP